MCDQNAAGPWMLLLMALAFGMGAGCAASPARPSNDLSQMDVPLVCGPDRVGTLRCLWASRLPVNQIGSPGMSDGRTIYFNVGPIIAVDEETGGISWNYDGEHAGGSNIYSPPVVTDRHLFAGTNGYTVVSLDRATGRLEWVHKTDGWVQAPLLIDVEHDRLFASSWDNQVRAIRLSSGEALWSAPLKGRPGFAAALVAGALCLVDGAELRCVDAETGGELACKVFGEPLLSGPIPYRDRRIIVLGGDGLLYDLELERREGEATLQERGRVVAAEPGIRLQEGFPHGGFKWCGDQLVLFCPDANFVFAYDASSMSLKWTMSSRSGRRIICSLGEYSAKRLLVGQWDGSVAALDPRRGAHQLWSAQLPGFDHYLLTSVSEDVFVAASIDGRIAAYQIVDSN